MATLSITEFRDSGKDASGRVVSAAELPALAAQSVAVGAASAASTVLQAGTGLVRLCADVACRVIVGTGTPTALATSMLLASGVPEYFAVRPGSGASLKVAVIQA